MFNNQTDLTIDGLMVVNQDPSRSPIKRANRDWSNPLFKLPELVSDVKVVRVNNQIVYREVETRVRDPEIDDTKYLALKLFGPITKSLELLDHYSKAHTINPEICDRCGTHLNILNRTEFSLCKVCDKEVSESTNRINPNNIPISLKLLGIL